MPMNGFIRRHRSLFSFLQQSADILGIWLCFYVSASFFAGSFDRTYVLASVIACFSYYFFAKQSSLYASWRGDALIKEVREVLKAWALTILICLLIAYSMKISEHFSRMAIGFWLISTPLVLTLIRITTRTVLRVMRASGRNTKKIVIIGSGKLGQTLARTLLERPWIGVTLVGFYDNKTTSKIIEINGQKFPILGSVFEANKAALANEFEEVYIAKPILDDSMKMLISALSNTSVQVQYVPDIFTFNLMHSRIREIGGLPIISVYDTPLDSFGQIIKRGEDLIVGALILCLIALPMSLIGVAVKLTSKGPALFKQKRYGLDGEEILVWKFRSMTVQDDGDVVNQATKGDSRITSLGAFLRKTSLDELPQFINVLQGTMSIVGPRPHAVAHNEFYRNEIDGYMLRHKMKPGITGWAQVNGWRGETDTNEKMEKRVEFDLHYIQHWSLWLDLKIIFLTVFKGFVHPNAY